MRKGQNPHHPKPGTTIKVDPIRERWAIDAIKDLLKDHPRNACLFTLGINTALRAGELLSIQVGDVKHLKVGDTLPLKQSKTQKYRQLTLNENAIASSDYLLHHLDLDDDAYLFQSQRRCKKLTVPTVCNLVKHWCHTVGLSGHFGSHTIRKTWGYWQYQNQTPLPLLMTAFGHTREAQTLEYLCIQPPEIAQIYQLVL